MEVETITQKIAMSLIDDPEIAMRDNINAESLTDLVGSIRNNGLLNPLIVRRKGDRFEVIAGHRRLQALGILRVSEAPCVVRDVDDRQATVLRVHENLVREEVDPVSEARFICETILQLGCKPEEYAEIIGRSVAYVMDRIEIASMPDYMQSAIKDGSIKLGVALALNEISDELYRKRWFESAIRDGMTVRGARDALSMFKSVMELRSTDPEHAILYTLPDTPPVLIDQCKRCGARAPITEMMMVRVHLREVDCNPEGTN